MGETKCFYHFDNIAINKCEKCGKRICEECTQVFSKKRFFDEKGITRKLCPSCSVDQYSGINFFMFSLIIYLVLMMFTTLAFDFWGILIPTFLFIIWVIAGSIVLWTKYHEQRRKAKEIYRKALKTRARDFQKRKRIELLKKPKGKPGLITAVYCRFCGAPLPLGENTCEYCGMTWVWE